MHTRNVALALTCAALGCAEDPTAEGTWDLVDPAAWSLVPLADDPFDPPADAACDPRGVQLEEGTVEVLTDLCGWATLTQSAAVDVAPGDALAWFAFHGPLTAAEPAEGVMILQVDGETLWSVTVPIPSGEGIYLEDAVADQAWPEGAEVTLHVHNHGANAWRFVHLRRTR